MGRTDSWRFDEGDRITHDLYGLGRVTKTDSHGVTVDFGSQTLRIVHPYSKLHHL